MAASVARTSLLRQMGAAPRSAVVARTAAMSPRGVIAARPAFQSTLMRATAFHTSSRKSAILPAGPQRVDGGVNDPAPVPPPNSAHGSYHWIFERVLAASLIPLSIAPFAGASLNPTIDAILCSVVLLHSHLGLQSAIIDYVPEKGYPVLRKICWWGLRLATVLTGIGIYEFETNDIGVTEGIKRVWKA